MNLARKTKVRKLALWTWSWVATLAIATYGSKYIWDDHAFLTTFSIIVNLINGVLMILSNRDLFNDFDELEKKIHLESMAITLGLSVIVGLTFSLVERAGLFNFKAEISYLVMFIGISYLVSFVVNTRRYT
ncbi:hypothetical protein SAMN05421813_13531 [Daejeonella rubra]|uniref:Uncharacterized protein n=1 Tax=Daejeonella rubra TaxID=990371 RepID=A0A1G9Y4F5_9SPHI|nr:hypothetical protein [Daejeonella rubra]SDN04012.1 hypothetical protein SAMN05421813_13531 [Daejeonella rubra]